MTPFIPGLELSRRFYEEVVRPLIERHFSGLAHAAARIGPGSEVLGFDTPMSTDHDWGPAVQLFVRDTDAELIPAIDAALLAELPPLFAGYPVLVPAGADAPSDTPGAYHRVLTTTLRAFVQEQIAHDIDTPFEPADWLTISSQKLCELTGGAVHHDGAGELTALLAKLAYYPRDVWLYLLAAGWQRIGQEEHLMPRAGFVGDELGASIIGARLARDVISLAFLLERRYAPYPKWFGSAFRRLRSAATLGPLLEQAQHADHWSERAAALGAAYVHLAGMQNELGLTPPVSTELVSFFGRPFPVIYGGEIARALVAELRDPAVVQIASRRLIGSIDQWSDSTDLRADAGWRPLLKRLYC
jgi:hypothetical protein